jgi:hypothetical protein
LDAWDPDEQSAEAVRVFYAWCEGKLGYPECAVRAEDWDRDNGWAQDWADYVAGQLDAGCEEHYTWWDLHTREADEAFDLWDLLHGFENEYWELHAARLRRAARVAWRTRRRRPRKGLWDVYAQRIAHYPADINSPLDETDP